MRYRLPSILVLLAAATGCAPGGDSSSEMVRMVLPDGDVATGREAFIDLKCPACHEVSGIQGLPPVEAIPPGPDLGTSLKGVGRGAIASSIIAPAHVNTERVELWTDLTAEERVWLGPGAIPPREKAESRPSRMAAYADVMTVRQLTDLVSFLRSNANKD